MAERARLRVADEPDVQSQALERLLTDQFSAIMLDVSAELDIVWPACLAFAAEHGTQLSSAADQVIPRLVGTIGDHALEHTAAAPELDPLLVAMFEQLGRTQFQQGRDLNGLLTAYQSGAQVAWEHISRAAIEVQLDSRRVSRLAQTLFMLTHDISARTTDGYVREQSERGLVSHRARGELSGLLMSSLPDRNGVLLAADQAGWPVPDELSFVLLRDDGEPPLRTSPRLDPEWLVVHVDDIVGWLVPWVAGIRPRLERALGDTPAVIGPPVPINDARRSMRVARIARRLQAGGALPDRLIFVPDHLDTLLVHRNPELLAALRDRVLAPLGQVPEASRDRLVETLTSWLRHFGSRSAVAEELHIHPQTVRYRMDQVRQVFGDALDDPDQREQLFLALVWGPPSR
ncbi:helix-turn-helix domain-containing protein [Flexivirga sp. ID2601S]|uniref:Helix-turn-helix domain-containing protein n=1 Tax=Flexivirga aerilata TaxID=1656889 RepID=A0A849AF58_9MICO|nr:helix-turn-helix domain-containing protein [Flexivirga aerilata]NNG38463.1 helix-turn-helix domain-containing protein [Flexivirga aerilata]